MKPLDNPGLALPRGADPGRQRGSLARAHEDFLVNGSLNTSLRHIVAESWQLSLRSGVDPDRVLPPVELTDAELESYRSGHPLAAVMPLIRRLLVEDAEGTNAIVAVADSRARLLWVEGDSRLVRQAEAMHWMPGALWDEPNAGTNAPATALRLDRAVQFFSREHFAANVAAWSCAAAPIHDPRTGNLLGVLDVTGRDEVAAPAVLGLIRAAVAAVESELRFVALEQHHSRVGSESGPASKRIFAVGTPGPAATALPDELRILGVDRAILTLDGVTSRLSQRHSELLLLLAGRDQGYTADQLAIALHEQDVAPVTVRAEMSRLRPLIPGLDLQARPYRLGAVLSTDADRVRAALSHDLEAALTAYRGPILPSSVSPAVEHLRDDLDRDVRAAILASSNYELVYQFARSDSGRSDLSIWEHALNLAPPSAKPVLADAVAALQRELGVA